MRFAKVITGVAISAALAIGTTGCTMPGETGSTANNAAGDGPVVIGFSQATQQSPFYVALSDAARQTAEGAGNEFYFADANGDVTKQNNDVQDLITRGINVLVINPVDPKGIAPSLAAADAAGIRVVTVDRPVYVALTLPTRSGPTPIQALSDLIARTMPAVPIDPNPAR